MNKKFVVASNGKSKSIKSSWNKFTAVLKQKFRHFFQGCKNWFSCVIKVFVDNKWFYGVKNVCVRQICVWLRLDLIKWFASKLRTQTCSSVARNSTKIKKELFLEQPWLAIVERYLNQTFIRFTVAYFNFPLIDTYFLIQGLQLLFIALCQ
jgi:hypothetical protein